MTKPTQKQRTFTRNNFAEHNYNYVNRPQTTKPFLAKHAKSIIFTKTKFPTTNIKFSTFNDYPRILQDQSENYPFFQQNKNHRQQNRIRHQTPYYIFNYLSSDDEDYYNQNHQQFLSKSKTPLLPRKSSKNF